MSTSGLQLSTELTLDFFGFEAVRQREELLPVARHSCALQSAPIRMFDAERMDGLDSSAQRQRAKVVGTDFGRRTQGGDRFRRCDEQASDVAGRLLEAPGRVHDIAMEDDRTAYLTDLASDDLA